MADAIAERDPARLLVARLAQEFIDHSEDLAVEVADRIHSDIAELPEDPEFRTGTLESGTRIIRQIALQLRDGGDMSDFRPPQVSIDYAGEYVHRGVDLPVLLAVIRIGYAVFARRWSERLQASDAPANEIAEALGQSLLDIFTYVDTISAGLSAAYSDEREHWSRSLEATRMDLVRAILDSNAIDAASTERRLNHRLEGPHHAFVVWSDAEHATGLRDALQTVAQQVTTAVGAPRSLVLPLGTKTVAGWIGGELDEDRWDALSDADISPPESQHVHVALGTTKQGLAGFRESHEQAHLARRVAQLRRTRRGTVTHYADVALLALATKTLPEARAFVAHTLGPLAASDPATRRLATTARIYLEEGRNRARTSRRLGVHANTIAYRLTRAEELLGHPLDAHAAAVEVALSIALMVDDVERDASG